MIKLYGDVFADTFGDFLFIFGGNVPGNGLKLVADRAFEFEGQRVSIRGQFSEAGGFSKLPPFEAQRIVSHTAIAELAYNFSTMHPSDSPEANWLRAENELLS